MPFTRKEALLSSMAFALWPRVASQSVDRAFVFLDRMMDLYASGATLRLAQSFVPTKALDLGSTAYVYDDAVLLIALLGRGRPSDVARAKILGNAFVYAQQNDPIGDGRIRNAYYTDPFISRSGALSLSDSGTDTGNMAWIGMALCQLYAKTHESAFLNAAIAAGEWLVANTTDTRGPGGYTGGHGILWKSTENNVDVYAHFSMLQALTGDRTWGPRAASAASLVEAMWSPRGFYWIGTVNDGKTPNTTPIPEDTQTWTPLGLGKLAHAQAIDWAEIHLAAVDGPFKGVSFSNYDRSGVWFEGTAHLAAALRIRNLPGDAAKAASYLSDVEYAQYHAPNADTYGIVAASKNGLHTGDGDRYFAALHVGATAWYALAGLGRNPFRIPL